MKGVLVITLLETGVYWDVQMGTCSYPSDRTGIYLGIYCVSFH